MLRPQSVRRIPISTRSITGRLGDQEFESALERDLFMQLAWDHDEIAWYAAQPVTIEYEVSPGQTRRYTPDVLVEFKKRADNHPTPLLCEVKYRRELAKNWRELRPKFRAAQGYCEERGWRFAVLDEDDIRTTRLENIQFLWRYRNADYPADLAAQLLRALEDRGESTHGQLIDMVAATWSMERRAQTIWTFWSLVARRRIVFDDSSPITHSTIFSTEGCAS